MLTLRQLEFAVAVADEGGFTAAARRCNTVQSALSHQVAKIEETLGARLFRTWHPPGAAYRSRRGVPA